MICVMKVAPISRLCWADMPEIVEALAEWYPDIKANSLDLEEVRLRVVTLPGFDDAPGNADQTVLLTVRDAWHAKGC